MYKKTKKYFIPHKDNEHKPYIFRWKAVLVILSLLLFVEIYFLAQVLLIIPSDNIIFNMRASIIPDAIFSFTNDNRLDNDLNYLKRNSLLDEAAKLKAEDMASEEYFAHTSPEGLKAWDFINKVGYKFNSAGENLAINFLDSQDVIDAWMDSPTHRANILNNNFTEIGIGMAKGEYEGKETIFIVQLLAFPKDEKVSVVAVKETKPQETKPQEAVSPPQPIVASSEETIIIIENNDQGEVLSMETTIPEVTVSNVLNKNSSISFVNKWLASPHALTNFIYFILLTILSLALILNVFIKRKIQHATLIVNASLLLLIISFVIWLNAFIVLSPVRIL